MFFNPKIKYFLILCFTIQDFVLCQRQQEKEEVNNRIDCRLIYNSINQEQCQKRDCIWNPTQNRPDVPSCYFDPTQIGYKLQQKLQTNPRGLSAELWLKDSARQSVNFEQIYKLDFKVTHMTENIVRVQIVDFNEKRYEVPTEMLGFNLDFDEPNSDNLTYKVDINNSNPFSFEVTRKSTGVKIFDTSIGGPIFGNQFLLFATYLPTSDIYGFGEEWHAKLRHEASYQSHSIFVFYNYSTRSAHPFYMGVESDGKTHGVLWLNSNAQSYTLMPDSSLSWISTGGVFDFIVFVGDNPEHVIQLYSSVIGKPALPPFWALGFHLSRFGLQTLADMKSLIQRNLVAHIPMDAFHTEIDLAQDYIRQFSYDPQRYAHFVEYVNQIREETGIRWVMLQDPRIVATNATDYAPFVNGIKSNVFIRLPPNPPNSQEYYYGTWGSSLTLYPDFFKNSTKMWWLENIQQWYNQIKFDGIWVHLNFPINEDNNRPCITDSYQIVYPQQPFPQPLNKYTICMDLPQGESNEFRHYDVHNLYGLTENMATYQALREVTGKRPFLLTSANFVSSGRYAGHWSGNNPATWESLRQSIVHLLEFNLFVMPFTGSEICSFAGESSAELCRRWYQLGAFYPLARYRKANTIKDQDPAVWATVGHPEVTLAAEAALRTRYQLLPYLYTRFYRAHVTGETVARPVMHEFPQDLRARSLDTQFMLGPAVMVAPFIFEKATTTTAYLPGSSAWYQMVAGFVAKVTPNAKNEFTLPEWTSSRPLLFRAGHIIPLVTASQMPESLNTDRLRRLPLELWVLPNGTSASGDLYFDQGDSLDPVEKGHFNYYQFDWRQCNLIITVLKSGYLEEPLWLNAVKLPLDNFRKLDKNQIELVVNGELNHTWNLDLVQEEEEGIIIKYIHLTNYYNLVSLNATLIISFLDKTTGNCISL